MGELAKRFGKQIRALRREHGLTQAQLAEATGLSEEWVRRLERGDGTPSFDALEVFSSVLGVPVAELFDRAPSPEQRKMAGIYQLARGLSDAEVVWLEGVLRAILQRKPPRRGSRGT